MYSYVRGIHFSSFYDFLLDFRTGRPMWYFFPVILLLNACYINISYLFVLIYSKEIIIKYYINCNHIYIVILSNRLVLFLRLISRSSTILLHLEILGFRLSFLTCMVAYELVWWLTNLYGRLRTCKVTYEPSELPNLH